MKAMFYNNGDRGGWRLCFLVAQGPKNVTLLELARLKSVTIPVVDLCYTRETDIGGPKHIRRRLERKHRALTRSKTKHAVALVERAITELRGMETA